ncbi:MAG: hypothetical protein AAF804_08240, partial [Bacteroidota bacterium]
MGYLGTHKGWYITVSTVLIGLALYGIASAVDWGTVGPPANIQEFEFTVWRDTLHGNQVRNGLTISLSEREKTRASLLILNNQDSLIPFQALERKRFHLLVVGEPLPGFTASLRRYAPLSMKQVNSVVGLNPSYFLGYNPVIVAVNQPQDNPFTIRDFIDDVENFAPTVVVNFGDSDRLRAFN